MDISNHNFPFTIFISHDHDDREIVKYIVDLIEDLFGQRQFNIFYSSSKDIILTGDKWRSLVVEKLLAAKLVIVLFTPNSLKSSWVIHESGAGWILEKQNIDEELKLTLLPCFVGIKFEELPDTLKDHLASDLTSEADVEKLIRSLDRYGDKGLTNRSISEKCINFTQDINKLAGRLYPSSPEDDDLGYYLLNYADPSISIERLNFYKELSEKGFISRKIYRKILRIVRNRT